MNNYITLDSYKYAVLSRSWKRTPRTGKSVYGTLNGTLDVTFGPVTMFETAGEILAPVTARGTGWGTITNLRSTIAKKQTVSYTDNYGDTSTVAIIGGEESSMSPMWDGQHNSWIVEVEMVSK